MDKAQTIIVVDDDVMLGQQITSRLTEAGFSVSHRTSSRQALDEIIESPPDAVLLDIMMPELDGMEMCRRLRADARLGDTRIIMLSTKSFEFDRRRARQLGADGFVTKPLDLDQLADTVCCLLRDEMTVTYWGVRGTLPVPGAKSLRYGGNTSCVTMLFPQGDLFIFDAGSGIKELSNSLMRDNPGRIAGRLFLSHPHWDHINALPFFVPLYIVGNHFDIFGPSHGGLRLEDLIGAQMDGVYFPITMREFGASVHFRALHEQSVTFDGIEVRTMLLNHPGYCLGYRVNYHGRSVCYVTDNELPPVEASTHDPEYRQRLGAFIADCDLLITDVTYRDHEYPRKVGWGHSAVTPVVDLAHDFRVKTLHLFHHDPDQNDDDIDTKLAEASARLAARNSNTRCAAPAEATVIRLSAAPHNTIGPKN